MSVPSATVNGEWWTFDRYGKKGAMLRLDQTIDSLHLLAIRTPKAPPPNPPENLLPEEEKPKLIFRDEKELRAMKSPKSPTDGSAGPTEIEKLLARSQRDQRAAGGKSRRIGEEMDAEEEAEMEAADALKKR